MDGKSHLVATTCCAYLLGAGPAGLLGAALGSKFPDLDLKVGLEHRTWTHWWPVGALLMAGSLFIPDIRLDRVVPVGDLPEGLSGILGSTLHLPEMLFWFGAGNLLHLLEDAITMKGIPVVWPTGAFENRGVPFREACRSRKRWSLCWSESGGGLEKAIAGSLFAAVLVSLWMHGQLDLGPLRRIVGGDLW